MSVLYQPTLTPTQRRALELHRKLHSTRPPPPPPKTRAQIVEELRVRFCNGSPEALFPGHPRLNDQYKHWGPKQLFPGHPDVQGPLTIEAIQQAVCKEFDVDIADILSTQKVQRVVEPRQVGIYLATVLTKWPLAFIGSRFNRDHTSVLHAKAVVGWKIGIRPDPPPAKIRLSPGLLNSPVDEVLRERVERLMMLFTA